MADRQDGQGKDLGGHGSAVPSGTAAMLEAFHALISHPDTDGLWLRSTLHDEEHDELVAALDSGDRAAIARELADVVYVAYGTALASGIDLDAALAEVHRANMQKARAGVRRADGKVIKPPGFVPPDMTTAIASAGGTTGDAERRPPESASGSELAGRMADRPGDPDAHVVREQLTHLGPWRAVTGMEAFDRIEARLSKAERERDWAREKWQARNMAVGKTWREVCERAEAAEAALRELADRAGQVVAECNGGQPEEGWQWAPTLSSLDDLEVAVVAARAALTTEPGHPPT